MAGVNTRLARFIMEAAPPQFVSVMRRRTSKMLDTIIEEDHRADIGSTATRAVSAHSSSSSVMKGPIITKLPYSSSASGSNFAATATNPGYFCNGVDRSVSIFQD